MQAGVKNYPFILCDYGAAFGETNSFYTVKIDLDRSRLGQDSCIS